MTDKDLLRAQLLVEAADILNETNNSVVSKNIAFLKQFGYKELSDNDKNKIKELLGIEDMPKNLGRITVDGKEFIANPGAYYIDFKSKKRLNASYASPSIYHRLKPAALINLGGKSFSNMSDDEKKTILYHEVGHSKLMHPKDIDTTHALEDAKKTADEHIFKERAVRKNETDKNNKRLGEKDDYWDEDEYLNAKKRYDNIPRLSKYTRKSLGKHSSPKELEADIYSIEHSKADPKAIKSAISSFASLATSGKKHHGRRYELNALEQKINLAKDRKKKIYDQTTGDVNTHMNVARDCIERADKDIKDLKRELRENRYDSYDRDRIISQIKAYETYKEGVKKDLKVAVKDNKTTLTKTIKKKDSVIKDLSKDRKKYLGMTDEEFNTYMKKRNEKNTKKYIKDVNKDAKLRTKAVLDKKIDHTPYK